MKTKTKKKKRDPLAGDRTPTGQLYRAVRRYVESKGGTILVIGGVQVEQWPGMSELNFVLGVRCMGRKPTPVESKS
jgi:hypothetical protein